MKDAIIITVPPPVRNRTSPPPTSKAGTVPADSGRSVTTMSSASTEQSNPEETSPSTAHIAWGGTNGQSASAMSADWTGRSPRRYTHRRATHRTHPTGEGATACLPRCEAGARTP